MGRSISERFLLGPSSDLGHPLEVPSLDDVQSLGPSIHAMSPGFDEAGLVEIFGQHGESLGAIARTLPDAEIIGGYRGPTEAIVWINLERTIEAIAVLKSHDTEAHVQAIRESKRFLGQFIGMNWEHAPSIATLSDIDGVSGATLTSLAMARGLFARMGSKASRSVFTEALDLEDALRVFPHATQIVGDPVATLRGEKGQVIGWLLRTGGLLEDEVGYQGPSELLIGFALDDQVHRLIIRQSFDNEPYVGYLTSERSFFKAYEGKTLQELVAGSPADDPIEGVSGATMTSVMVAEMIPKLAEKIEWGGGIGTWKSKTLLETPWQRLALHAKRWWLSIRFAPGEVATLVILVGLPLLIRRGWMRRRSTRVVWLVAVIVIIGLWAGNFVSLSLLVGVVTSGISWSIAIGLLSMILVTLLLPPVTKTNPYCNHLCPHGAVQQLVRPNPRSKRRRRLPVRLSKWLRRIPATLLVIACLLLLLRPEADVSSMEPFHAYLWRVSGWTAIAFAVISLAFSAIVPMGYCRYGCPTGRLLEHLRFTARSGRITAFDCTTLGLLIVAIIVRAY